jgi:hypothetical protein
MSYILVKLTKLSWLLVGCLYILVRYFTLPSEEGNYTVN